ncbi:thiol reductant ABC exporter subunit CydD [Streptomyces meridianus]|uniref:Thiol reductant ABC exporter subunit CydD n=1 Tax=Streptomyces meridianus TaxID=2938945 RepID=A0ABT0X7N7_9ACTN|nr:thiol reductant ABC exporter subunit CydD [Streptomyces meridianus]MCM2578542.1 thiol reductant ABC exporter subunit CydD [Streptomyces meridianus]
MKPVDPRLWRHARATRVFLAAAVGLGLAGALLITAQAVLIADVVTGAFRDGAPAASLRGALLLLAAVAAGRALVAWLTELSAHRASASAKSALRMRLLEHAVRLGPLRIGERRGGELATLVTRGIDALDDYFARYLPQLGLAVVVPVVVLVPVVGADWVSAAVIVVTLPLIPLFMALVGRATQARMDRQWTVLSRLSGHFLDVVSGLATLKVFGRAKAQNEAVRRITGDYRRATMRTLRIAFLSSLVLELLSTLSVALVAVGIGMRLVHGDLDLHTALIVLVLAPEAYLPLRQVGAQYHAAAEGMAAAEEVFAVLETGLPADGTAPAPDARSAALHVEGLVVRHPGRSAPALPETTFTVRPGETVAISGPSGCGKSTLLRTVLGFCEPAHGRVRFGAAEVAAAPAGRSPAAGSGSPGSATEPEGCGPAQRVSRESLHRQIAWVPQQPHLFAGTIADNVRAARPGADDGHVARALRDAGAGEFVRELPDGSATVLGEDGHGLSAGQRRRIALARAFLADRPLLLLDEPTAGLDGGTEAEVVEAVRRLARGRTVLLVAHRPALLAVADRVVRIAPDTAAPDARPAAAGTAPAAGEPGPAYAPDAPGSSGPADGPGPDARRSPSPATPPGRTVPALRRVRRGARSRRGRFLTALLLGALATGSAVGLAAVSGWLISRASQQPPVLYLMVAVTATRAFGIGRAAFRYAERLVSHDAVFRMLADLRAAVHRRLERLAPAGLGRTRRGDLLSRLVADVDSLQDYFLRGLLPAGTAVLVSAAAAGFTSWLLPEAGALLAAGLLAAGAGVPLLTGALARRTQRQLAPARGELAARVLDLLAGAAELTVAGALGRRLDGIRSADRRLTGIAARSSAAAGAGAGLTALICGLTVTGTAWAGARAVADGRLPGVALAVVVLLPLAAFEAVAGLPAAATHRQRARRAAERIHEIVDAPDPVREPASPAPVPENPFPFVLRDLTTRHPGSPRPALHGLDLEINRGRRIAVVGPSGSGKTTLAHVLLRFLDPESGTYTLAGRDATACDGDDVRRSVGLCAQDAHVFDSSLRENLRLARPGASDARLREALAGARLLDWVDGLPRGLDTLVGEHGARLSGGQRQRLALARALLAGFPVLLLDEPAEHLDVPTADALTADLLDATEGRTTVLITHRLAGLEAVDEVVVLDRGRVVQRGTYDLLAVVPGPFRSMLELELERSAETARA